MPVPTKANRPLSPHLTIYRPQLTSVLSILHRITGIGLIVSIILMISWFVGLSLGPLQLNFIENIFNSIFIQLVLVVSVWSLWYHTCTGVRHLIWDLGYGLEIKSIGSSSLFVLVGSLLLTAVTLYLGWVI